MMVSKMQQRSQTRATALQTVLMDPTAQSSAASSGVSVPGRTLNGSNKDLPLGGVLRTGVLGYWPTGTLDPKPYSIV